MLGTWCSKDAETRRGLSVERIQVRLAGNGQGDKAGGDGHVVIMCRSDHRVDEEEVRKEFWDRCGCQHGRPRSVRPAPVVDCANRPGHTHEQPTSPAGRAADPGTREAVIPGALNLAPGCGIAGPLTLQRPSKGHTHHLPLDKGSSRSPKLVIPHITDHGSHHTPQTIQSQQAPGLSQAISLAPTPIKAKIQIINSKKAPKLPSAISLAPTASAISLAPTPPREPNQLIESAETVTTAPPPSGIHIIKGHVKPIDLFPNITADLMKRVAAYNAQVAAHEANPKTVKKPWKTQIIACNPTDAENTSALEYVKANFVQVHDGYTKIYNESTSQLIAIVQYLPIESMPNGQLDELNFLTSFLNRYEALMSESSKAGKILWKLFHSFGNVAVEKNKAYMDCHGIPSIADVNFPKSAEDKPAKVTDLGR
ncbi:hypothetical protein PtB15_6B714 [Puccinia triticina]|nr:hypothetical protein PtB15_6B714 [Puccinia triticina]